MELERSYACLEGYPDGFLARQAVWVAYRLARHDGFRRRVVRTRLRKTPHWQVWRLPGTVLGRATASSQVLRVIPECDGTHGTAEALRVAHRAEGARG